MGKTVKSRTIFSILSFLMVIVFCVVANSSVPQLYESYKQKEIAQQAATQTTKTVEKKNQGTQQSTEPAEEPATDVVDSNGDEDSNVYDVEEPVAEEPIEEDSEDDSDVDFDFGFDTDEESDSKNDSGFLNTIIDFFGSLFEKLANCKLVKFFKDLLAKILSVFGITL